MLTFTQEELDAPIVILVKGINLFGDHVFSYVKMPLFRLADMKDALDAGQNFKPSDFGQVLAAGRGEPDPELRSEMAVTYNLVDVQQPPPSDEGLALPKFFGGN